jgi:4-amino-4-deoxy-L-arabinose transferase-like glycosyltransferase
VTNKFPLRKFPLRFQYSRNILIAIALLLVFNLLTLGRIPEIPHGDDGGYASAAYQFWRTGHPGVPGYRNILGLDKDIFVFGRTAAAVQGIFMWIFGVSLTAALLPSFLSGVGLIVVTYGLGRTLWDKHHGLLAAVILTASGIFFLASRIARPDLLLALCFISALYLLASALPGRWSWRYPLAGLVMGLSGDLHLNGFFLAPIPLLFWFSLREERFHLRSMSAASYLVGVFLGGIFWLSLHYWPNPEAFTQQIEIFGGKTHGIRVVNLGLWGAIKGEIQRYLSWFWVAKLHRNIFEGLFIFVCGLWMLILGGRKERALFFAWFFIFGMSVLLMANPFGWYLIYVWPLFVLWIARVFLWAYHTRVRRWAVIFLCVLLIGSLGNLVLWTGKAFYGPSYAEISRELRSTIPPGAAVVAGGEWWFALSDRDFTDAQHVQFQALLAKERKEAPSSNWEHAWGRLRWQYAVAYGDSRDMLDREVPLNEAFASMGVSRAEEIREARAFGMKHCHVVARISTASTPVLIMKIN